MIRIVLIHDDTLLRLFIRQILENTPGIQIVGNAGTGKEGIKYTKKHQPDVVILSWQLPDMTGKTALTRLVKLRPISHVLIVSLSVEQVVSPDILSNGARGYLTSHTTPEELVEAIQSVSVGKAFISDEICQHIESADRLLSTPVLRKSTQPIRRRFSKTADNIHTLEDVLNDLQYLLADFPMAALKAASRYQQQITPILLGYVDDIIIHPKKIKKRHYCAHIYAIYLLAQFREKTLFPKLISALKIQKKNKEAAWNEVAAYDMTNIMASTFNGHLKLIYALIEDPKVDDWVRSCAIGTLLALYTIGEISYSTIVDYYRYLLIKGLEKSNGYLWADLAWYIMQLYAEELFDALIEAFKAGYIDPEITCLYDLEQTLAKGKEAGREYCSQFYYIIKDAAVEMLEESDHPVARCIRENIIVDLEQQNNDLDIRAINFVDWYQPGQHYPEIIIEWSTL